MSDGAIDPQTRKRFPCLFVFEGSIKLYSKSMLVLNTKITPREWELIVDETVRYYNFLIALKEVGMPKLRERWTKLCEYFLRGLEVNVGRMRNIDPLLVARIDQASLLAAYKSKMEINSEEVLREVQQVKDQLAAQEGITQVDLNIVSDM